jgi:alpha-tubulin suppressor-like RCC1 family protein
VAGDASSPRGGLLVLSLVTLSGAPPVGASPDIKPVTVVDVAAGYRHSCAVTNVGAVHCWGENIWGQMGDGTRTFRPKPTEVVGLNYTIVSVTAGNYEPIDLKT